MKSDRRVALSTSCSGETPLIPSSVPPVSRGLRFIAAIRGGSHGRGVSRTVRGPAEQVH